MISDPQPPTPNPRLISVDDHVQEPPDLWTQRLSKARWGDRVPHVKEQPDGTQRWVVDGQPLALDGVASAGAFMPDRSREPQRWEEVPPAAYRPQDRLRAMDAGGIDASVLYPTVAGVGGETFGRLTDPELELACVQAYNDWLLEEWASASDRFIPQCIVPLHPPEAAVAEIRRSVAKGHRGVIYPGNPMELREVPHINEPEYDVIWATCQELKVPLCMHAGASVKSQFAPYAGFSPAMAAALAAVTRPASTVFALVNLLLSRILMRFPQLRVVFGESSLSWAAYLLEYADHQFEGDRLRNEGYSLKPSEMFRQHCYLTGWYDVASLAIRESIGTENILWCSKLPQATSTWPESWRAIERWAPQVPSAEREQILWRNAASLYGLEDAPKVQSSK